MNNKSNSTAPKIYKQICKQLNRPINYEVKAGLSETEFFLKIDLVCKVTNLLNWTRVILSPSFN